MARLVKIEPPRTPGARFLASHGSLAGKIIIGEDFEFTEEDKGWTHVPAGERVAVPVAAARA